MSNPTSPTPPYLIRTSTLPPSAFTTLAHHVDRTNTRAHISLGDSTGLTHTGVHLCRLAAGATSTTLHWHAQDDEWVFVLDAGPGAVLLVWEAPSLASSPSPSPSGAAAKEPPDVTPREEPLLPGDFLSFPAGVPRAHALRAGPAPDGGVTLTYLLGGSRAPLDVTHYPGARRRMVSVRAADGGAGASWTVEEGAVSERAVGAWPTFDGVHGEGE